MLGQRLAHLEVRDGLARLVRVERAMRGISPVSPDRGVDPAGARPRAPAHEREVAPVEITPPHGFLERAVRLIRARDDE